VCVPRNWKLRGTYWKHIIIARALMTDLITEHTPRLPSTPSSRVLPALIVGVAAVAVISWVLNTPEGILGKADAIGYAVCHRIDGRSFHLGDRQFPLCSRCTGMYLGALLGVVGMVLMGRGRAGGMPTRWVMVALFGFLGLMGIDGVNSYMHFFPGLPHLYEPQNWLRLITGMGNGLFLAGLILPVLNQTLWRNWDARPVLGSFRELALLVVAAAVVVALVLSDNVLVLYPLALLSSVGVLVLVVSLNTAILLMVLRRENRAAGWAGAVLPLLAGLTLAIIEIGMVDAVRFAIFGTWGGMPLPG
jgi:uncharacterized membrane protein